MKKKYVLWYEMENYGCYYREYIPFESELSKSDLLYFLFEKIQERKQEEKLGIYCKGPSTIADSKKQVFLSNLYHKEDWDILTLEEWFGE